MKECRPGFELVDCLDRDIWPIQVYIGSGKWACMGKDKWLLVTKIDNKIHWMEIHDPSNNLAFFEKQANWKEDDFSECQLLWEGEPGGLTTK